MNTVQLYTEAQINFGDLTPYLTYDLGERVKTQGSLYSYFGERSAPIGIDLDDSSKGWIVSLDYVMTAAVAIVSGQLQVSNPI